MEPKVCHLVPGRWDLPLRRRRMSHFLLCLSNHAGWRRRELVYLKGPFVDPR